MCVYGKKRSREKMPKQIVLVAPRDRYGTVRIHPNTHSQKGRRRFPRPSVFLSMRATMLLFAAVSLATNDVDGGRSLQPQPEPTQRRYAGEISRRLSLWASIPHAPLSHPSDSSVTMAAAAGSRGAADEGDAGMSGKSRVSQLESGMDAEVTRKLEGWHRSASDSVRDQPPHHTMSLYGTPGAAQPGLPMAAIAEDDSLAEVDPDVMKELAAADLLVATAHKQMEESAKGSGPPATRAEARAEQLDKYVHPLDPSIDWREEIRRESEGRLGARPARSAAASAAASSSHVTGGARPSALDDKAEVTPTYNASALQRNASLPRLLLYTTLFGKSAWHAPLLPLFLYSAGKAPDIDVVLLGDGEMPRGAPPLPPNVRRARHITRDSVVARLSGLTGVDLNAKWTDQTRTWKNIHNWLNHTLDYKVACDAKALLPMLFPAHLLNGYDWVGWVDNDMLLGGMALRHLLTELVGCRAALLPTLGEQRRKARPSLSFGPLSILRTQSYRRFVAPALQSPAGRRIVRDVFASSPYASRFDEWGVDSPKLKAPRYVTAKGSADPLAPAASAGSGGSRGHGGGALLPEEPVSFVRLANETSNEFAHSMSGLFHALVQQAEPKAVIEGFFLPDDIRAGNCPRGSGWYPHYKGTQFDDAPKQRGVDRCHLDGRGAVGALDGIEGGSSNGKDGKKQPAMLCHYHHRKRTLDGRRMRATAKGLATGRFHQLVL